MNKIHSVDYSRNFNFEFDELSKKLFVNIEHGFNCKPHNCDESYYAVLFALTNFINKHKSDDNFFTIGDAYFDKQVFLAMYESENLKIVVTSDIDKEKAIELSDEFISLYNSGFDLTLNNLIASGFIDSSEEAINKRMENKLVIKRTF